MKRFLYLFIFASLTCGALSAKVWGLDNKDDECFVPGKCSSETGLIHETKTLDDLACLTFCKSWVNCTHFSYFAESNDCKIYSECNKLDLACEDCTSGVVTCQPYDPCLFTGSCFGNQILEVPVGSNDECILTCQKNPACEWSTYDEGFSFCYLFSSCPTLDESCTSCISSSYYCHTRKRYSKIIVSAGLTSAGVTNNVEIIDLASSSTICPAFPAGPRAVYGQIGGLSNVNNPHIYGGFDGATHHSACSYYANGVWNNCVAMLTTREFGTLSETSITKTENSFFVTGGFNPTQLSSAEVTTATGWRALAPVPVTVTYHCTVPYNSTTYMLIGGYQNSSRSSSNVWLYNMELDAWTEGPSLRFGRQAHSCARIATSENSHTFDIIVVGGTNGSAMNSVEIFDISESYWRPGPTLPVGNYFNQLVEDRTGGVILVGGFTDTYSDKLYRLKNASKSSKWVELPQRLTTARRAHTSFIVPDAVLNCPITTS